MDVHMYLKNRSGRASSWKPHVRLLRHSSEMIPFLRPVYGSRYPSTAMSVFLMGYWLTSKRYAASPTVCKKLTTFRRTDQADIFVKLTQAGSWTVLCTQKTDRVTLTSQPQPRHPNSSCAYSLDKYRLPVYSRTMFIANNS